VRGVAVLDPETQRRIDKANRERRIFRVPPREYYVPRTLVERLIVRLGATAFWSATGIVALGLFLLAYLFLFGDMIGEVVAYVEPKTAASWALVLLLAVPVYGLCWLAPVAWLLGLERRFETRFPDAYRRSRMVLWAIIAAAAAIAFLIPWWGSVGTLPG
jgi:hypothetical protein